MVFRALRSLLLALPVIAGCAEQAPDVVLLGQRQHVATARTTLQSLPANPMVRENVAPGPDDVVLFVVDAADGPMPGTREQAEAVRGRRRGAAAIFLVGTRSITDPEMRQLVLIETRALLRRAGDPEAETMTVLADDDPNLQLLLHGLLTPPG